MWSFLVKISAAGGAVISFTEVVNRIEERDFFGRNRCAESTVGDTVEVDRSP